MLTPGTGPLATQFESLALSAEKWLTTLEDVPLSSLSAANCALIIVDMVNGFTTSGALSSERSAARIEPIASLARACAQRGMPVVAFADTHNPDSPEFDSYPPHCLRGSEEAKLCKPIADSLASVEFTLIEKSSTNGFLEPVFDVWRRENPSVTCFLVVGVCTDICVQQFAITAKTWYTSRNRPLRVLVPAALVDTFDGSGHPAEAMNAFSLLTMKANGVDVCRNMIV